MSIVSLCNGEYITFNKEKTQQLKKEILKAKENKDESFVFQNKELDTSYAQYLLEFLEETVNEKPRNTDT